MSIRSRTLSMALALGSILFVAPLVAQAIFYAPGETLNPACAPTDPACGVTTPFTLFQNGNVGIGTATPAARLDITGTNSNAVLGPEMIVATADRDFSSDTGKWTGTNWTIGSGVITHTAGANNLNLDISALSSLPAVGFLYQVTFTTNTTVAGTLTTSFGGVAGIAVGQSTGTNAQIQVITATGAGSLTFTPSAVWIGTIDNVSVKQITPSAAAEIVRNSNSTVGLEIRSGGSSLNNTLIGINAGQSNTTGISNTAIGVGALLSNTTGLQNTANGLQALQSNTSGSNNTSVGVQALQVNTIANQNTAIGSVALHANTTGTNNVAIGFGALFINTIGNNNIGIGFHSPNNLTTGSNNIIIGHNINATSSTATNSLNIGNLIFGIGVDGQVNTISSGSIGIGTTTPGAKLDVNGTIRQTGCINGALSSNASGDIICTSDLAYKQNVTPFTSGLSAIEGITPQYFQYKGESFTHAGFIAQNVQTVLPDAVSEQSNGSLGLDTNAILAAAVNAIKELDTRINGGVPTAIATAQSSLQSLAANIGQTASALTSDAFTQIASWLGDAGNGIGDFFANRVRTKELCVSDAGGETCVTRGQLDAVLAGTPLPPAPPATPPTPESVIATTPVIPPEATSTPLLPNTGSTVVFNRTLDIGSSGADVSALQSILMQKGFLYLLPTMVPGYFGELTRSAVMMYQTSVGLPPVGIVGLLTIAKLNAESGR